MQLTQYQMLTNTQISNLHKLPPNDLLQIMHECAEALGLVSVEDYNKLLGMPKRTIYSYIEQNKLLYFKLSSHFYIAINDKCHSVKLTE